MPSLYGDPLLEKMEIDLENQYSHEASVRRKSDRVFSVECAEGSITDMMPFNNWRTRQEAQVRAEAWRNYFVPGDLHFSQKLREHGDNISDIYLTIATLCEARMDEEIAEVQSVINGTVFKEEEGSRNRERSPVIDAYIKWQVFVMDQMTDLTGEDAVAIHDLICEGAEAWYRGEGALYPIYVAETGEVTDDPGSVGMGVFQTGDFEDHKLDIGVRNLSALIEEASEVEVPKVVEENFNLCEMAEDMDLFDLDCDIETAMHMWRPDGGVNRGLVLPGGPAEELGLKVTMLQVDHEVSTERYPSIYYNITIDPVIFQCSKFGKSYHTGEWKYGKAFIGMWDTESIFSNSSVSLVTNRLTSYGKQKLRMAGGVLKWRVINPEVRQKVMGHDETARILNDTLFKMSIKVQ